MQIIQNPSLFLAIFGTIVALAIFSFLLLKSSRRKTDKIEEIYQKLREEIRFAVAPKSIQLSVGVNDLVELATEVWRVEQRVVKFLDTLPENHKKGLENSLLKLKKYIAKYDVEIIDYTNQRFNDGLNLDILSVEKDSSITTPTVKETVEPTILVKGQVVKKAKIILLSN